MGFFFYRGKMSASPPVLVAGPGRPARPRGSKFRGVSRVLTGGYKGVLGTQELGVYSDEEEAAKAVDMAYLRLRRLAKQRARGESTGEEADRMTPDGYSFELNFPDLKLEMEYVVKWLCQNPTTNNPPTYTHTQYTHRQTLISLISLSLSLSLSHTHTHHTLTHTYCRNELDALPAKKRRRNSRRRPRSRQGAADVASSDDEVRFSYLLISLSLFLSTHTLICNYVP